MVDAIARNRHEWVLVYRFALPEVPDASGWFGAKKAREAVRAHAGASPFLQDPRQFRRFGLKVRVKGAALPLPDVALLVAAALTKEAVRKDRSAYARLGLLDDTTPRSLAYLETVHEEGKGGVDVEVFGLRA